jgi:hypothetical protein
MLEGNESFTKLASGHKYKVWEDPSLYWITCLQYKPLGEEGVVAKVFHVKGAVFDDKAVSNALRKSGMTFATDETD